MREPSELRKRHKGLSLLPGHMWKRKRYRDVPKVSLLSTAGGRGSVPKRRKSRSRAAECLR